MNTPVSKIVVHDKSAHLDDFLACAILAYKYPLIEIVRKSQPSQAELDDESVFVIDFGREHNPDKRNFDHHQLKTDVAGSVCAFTMVMEYFGMRDYDALPWLKFVEVWDHSGPPNALSLLGRVDSASDMLLYSPIVAAALNRFSHETVIRGYDGTDNFIRDILAMVGQDIQDSYLNYKNTYDELHAHGVMRGTVNTTHAVIIADLLACDFGESRSVSAEAKWQKEKGQSDCILTKNERGNGKYRLVRRGNRLDFSQAKDIDAGISFIHQSGFLIVFDDLTKAEDICLNSVVVKKLPSFGLGK